MMGNPIRLTMILRILRQIRSRHRGQSGFTFVELTVTLAICGIIALGATVANSQMISQTVKNNDYTTANRQVLNAIHWISRDAEMAQNIENWENFPLSDNLTLSWITWENLSVEVVYSIDAQGQLRRTYDIEGSPPQQLLVAQYVKIDAASSSCIWDNEELTLTLTASVGEGARVINVTHLNTTASRSKL
jgi:prepilin-type N-terminal cleavage/methylation domain-containing protein